MIEFPPKLPLHDDIPPEEFMYSEEQIQAFISLVENENTADNERKDALSLLIYQVISYAGLGEPLPYPLSAYLIDTLKRRDKQRLILPFYPPGAEKEDSFEIRLETALRVRVMQNQRKKMRKEVRDYSKLKERKRRAQPKELPRADIFEEVGKSMQVSRATVTRHCKDFKLVVEALQAVHGLMDMPSKRDIDSLPENYFNYLGEETETMEGFATWMELEELLPKKWKPTWTDLG